MATKKTAKKTPAAKKAAAGKTTAKKAAAKKTAAKKTATKKAAAKKTATKKTAAKKTAAKKTAPRKSAAKRSATKKSATKKPATTRKSAAKKSKSRGITPAKALKNTRKLLAAKQRQARQAPAWQQAVAEGSHGDVGYQSPEAAEKAQELHAAEIRLEGIHGSISTHDRHAQGRRDSR